jgi:hypothetical protein
VSDMAEAWRVALEMIRKLRQEDLSTAQDWLDWTLSAVDPAGVAVFTINLAAVF